MTTPNKIFSALSFIGFVLCCIPLRRHMQGNELVYGVSNLRSSCVSAWNIGTCLNMAWTGLACLTYFINSVMWNDNLNNLAPVWCDICEFPISVGSGGLTLVSASRFGLAFVIAVPVAILCTNRRLYFMTIGKMPSTVVEVVLTSDVLPLSTQSVFYTETPRYNV
jgi:hypothetical protein